MRDLSLPVPTRLADGLGREGALLASRDTPHSWVPRTVIFNTATDCFQPHPDILTVTFQAMALLLERGIDISFLTKGSIPRRFIDLFKAYRENVQAQIGLVSLSEGYWRSYEPGAASPREKLGNIEGLLAAGIETQVRVDPVIPFVTDTPGEAESLFRVLGRRGVRKVSLSYLHLRPAIQRQLRVELPPLHQKIMESCYQNQDWLEVGLSTKTKLLPRRLREVGYMRIKEVARSHGISAVICSCKNPDLQGETCLPPRARRAIPNLTHRRRQLLLFPCW